MSANTSVRKASDHEGETDPQEKLRIARQRRDALRDEWQKYDTDNSNSLDKDELKMLATELLQNTDLESRSVRSSSIMNEASKLTQREFDRELADLLQLLDVHRDGTVSFEEMDYYLFKKVCFLSFSCLSQSTSASLICEILDFLCS